MGIALAERAPLPKPIHSFRHRSSNDCNLGGKKSHLKTTLKGYPSPPQYTPGIQPKQYVGHNLLPQAEMFKVQNWNEV